MQFDVRLSTETKQNLYMQSDGKLTAETEQDLHLLILMLYKCNKIDEMLNKSIISELSC